VKGNRAVGSNISMQGGVCYNEAVPVAMAALTGKRIVVPPEPGLMGAFGVALEIKKRLALGLAEAKRFSLTALRDRTVAYGKSFVCGGGREKCDRKCTIARIGIEGEIYPFGGACNRWYNVRFRIEVDTERLNHVRRHEALTFPADAAERAQSPDTGAAAAASEPEAAPAMRGTGGAVAAGAPQPAPEAAGARGAIPAAAGAKPRAAHPELVGVNKSFLTNSFFPLYRRFFAALGLPVVLPAAPRQGGIDRKQAPFCYPAEIAHGFLEDLLANDPTWLFLPQIKGFEVANGPEAKTTCPILQAEPYYLEASFQEHAAYVELQERGRILRPVLDFSRGFAGAEDDFAALAVRLGRGRRQGREAYRLAVAEQERVGREMTAMGQAFLEELARHPEQIGVVLFGRSYNAFVTEANMGIPHKFASRGRAVLPFTFLPLAAEPVPASMYWATGQLILKGAALVRRHPQLFGCYITNFSCGPDSFLAGYFRDEMAPKPFLILELDSHVADAGLETRIEAFLDIVRNWRELERSGRRRAAPAAVSSQARAVYDHAAGAVRDARGRAHALTDPRVHVVFPSMGRFLLEAAAAVFRHHGIRATALPEPDEEVLKLGRGNTTCKECLPLLLTAGSLLKYLRERERDDELLLYFMPTTSGPCRFGQYRSFLERLLEREGVADATFFSLNAENGYGGFLGPELTLNVWTAIVIAGLMHDIHPVLLANALQREEALAAHRRTEERIIAALEADPDLRHMRQVLAAAAENLGRIPVSRTLVETPTVLLTGEIYVRHDDLSRQFIVERLAREGVATKVASVAEWLYYTDWCFAKGVSNTSPPTLRGRLSLLLKRQWMHRYERACRDTLARSGLCRRAGEDVEHIIGCARPFIDPSLTGEAILTVGAGLAEVPDPYCGLIAIGPFGCMPNRVAEAILARRMGTLPFLAVESDGNPFPQVITAKLEVFLMQAMRLFAQTRRAAGA
jgi:predicted nucleotide-binding protein (sugar kinase/HSP70/actin superfamily)